MLVIILILCAVLFLCLVVVSFSLEERQYQKIKQIVKNIRSRGCRTYKVDKNGNYNLVKDTFKPPTGP